MPKMNGMLLYEKLQNIDPDLLFCFITANKEYIEHLKKSITDIEKIVIYKPILLSALRSKINSLLSEKKLNFY
jgi:two-component SAPR family response regulator